MRKLERAGPQRTAEASRNRNRFFRNGKLFLLWFRVNLAPEPVFIIFKNVTFVKLNDPLPSRPMLPNLFEGFPVIRRRPKIRLVEEEREMMRAAGQFNAQLMDYIREFIVAGVKTHQIDKIIHDYTLDHGNAPACLGYPGDLFPFPKSSCISVNEVICHGIPDELELRDGDIVNVDITSIVDGWHGDQSETFIIGDHKKASDEARSVTQCAFDCLYLAINAIAPGCPISIIGETIVSYTKNNYGYGVVDKYVGHGIGARFHQRPNIPHVPTRQSRQERLHPGMCFTIEPMINGGTARSVCDRRDGWTVRTGDGHLSAQFEHTILMTENGPEILTLTMDGPQPGHLF